MSGFCLIELNSKSLVDEGRAAVFGMNKLLFWVVVLTLCALTDGFLAQAALNAAPFIPGSGLAGSASEGYQASKVKLSPDAVAFVPRAGTRDGSDSPGRSSR